MPLAGDELSMLAYAVQGVGILIGIGGVTVTLVTHLLSLHAHMPERAYAYVRGAEQARALALVVIIVAGIMAVLVHFQNGASTSFNTPVFVFGWMLALLLAAMHFLELRATGVTQDAVEGFEGAHWYALFIVHTFGPTIGWMLTLRVYLGWVVSFAVVWAIFVWIMRRHSTHRASVAQPVAAPGPVAPATAPASQTISVVTSVPTPAASAPVLKKETKVLQVAELDLPAPSKVEAPAPGPQVPVPSPAPVAPVPPTEPLPSITVMPKSPEDIK